MLALAGFLAAHSGAALILHLHEVDEDHHGHDCPLCQTLTGGQPAMPVEASGFQLDEAPFLESALFTANTFSLTFSLDEIVPRGPPLRIA